jgi:hypothetical protein
MGRWDGVAAMPQLQPLARALYGPAGSLQAAIRGLSCGAMNGQLLRDVSWTCGWRLAVASSLARRYFGNAGSGPVSMHVEILPHPVIVSLRR